MKRQSILKIREIKPLRWPTIKYVARIIPLMRMEYTGLKANSFLSRVSKKNSTPKIGRNLPVRMCIR